MAEQEAILKILEMLQTGTITAEQADRLIRELKGTQDTSEKTSSQKQAPEPDLFSTFQSIGDQMAKGFEDLARGFGVNFKSAMGVPQLQTLVVKTYQVEPEKELNHLNIPLHLFQAVRGLMTNKILTGTSPLIDFELVYRTLDQGSGGKLAEFVDLSKNERVEFWLE